MEEPKSVLAHYLSTTGFKANCQWTSCTHFYTSILYTKATILWFLLDYRGSYHDVWTLDIQGDDGLSTRDYGISVNILNGSY